MKVANFVTATDSNPFHKAEVIVLQFVGGKVS